MILLHYFLEKLGRDRILTACGRTVDLTKIAIGEPSCPQCQEWLHDERTAEEVFGTEEEIRQYGPPVRVRS